MRGKVKTVLGVILITSAVLSVGCTTLRDTHERLNGVLWIQTSAEYRTIAAATYREARSRVKEMLEDAKNGKTPPSAALEQEGTNVKNLPLAVIMDLDETVIDNSPMSGQLIKDRKGFSLTTWSDWVKFEKADFVEGAEDFIKEVQSEKVSVFFVTNRTKKEEESTIKTMKCLKVTEDQILSVDEKGEGETQAWDGEKQSRRKYLAKNYWIIAMVGDDLADFIPGIRKASPADRINEASKNLDRFGKQWFLLPNPLYGSWEGVLYKKDDPDKKQLIDKINIVKGYYQERSKDETARQ